LLSLPEIIRIIAPGVVTTQLSSLPPASSSAADVPGSSESRLATAQPPEPPPTTTKSNVSVTPVPPIFFFLSFRSRRQGPRQLEKAMQGVFQGGLRRTFQRLVPGVSLMSLVPRLVQGWAFAQLLARVARSAVLA
jgi:hypothetical protein